MGHNQTYKFCTTKETINKTKRQPMECEKISANDVTYKGLISKTYKELTLLNNKKQPSRGRRFT